MGLFNFLLGRQRQDLPAPQVTLSPPTGSRLFGLDKLASEATEEDVKQSNEALYEACADVIRSWRFDVSLDFKTTPFELAVYGMEAARKEDLPAIPEGYGYRIAVLPLTATAQLHREEDGDPGFITTVMVAETREELEAIKGARLYSSKTTKKETGRCYFKAAFDIKTTQADAPGNFLKACNPLTRRLALGEDLAADFEASTKRGGLNPQQWVTERLGHLAVS